MARLAVAVMSSGSIAVVITCRDLGRTLVEALDSVRRQTRPPAETIVVDDASTDIYTRQVLAHIEHEGQRVVRTDGRGASAARNAGVRLTSSAFIVCLDADDTLAPGYFAAAASRLDGDASLDFVSCAMRAFGAASYTWSPSATTFVDAVSTGAVPHASTMMRRRLWESAGGFDETLRSFELLDFWAGAMERGARGVVIEEPLLNYRVRSGSGYRRSIETGTYQERMRHFYTKHRDAVARHLRELVEGKEAFLLSQMEYRKTIEARAGALKEELDALRGRIAETTKALEARGISRVDWGDFRRTQPFSSYWGLDRGQSIDRYYIEQFLARHRADIRGKVLEVRDRRYTRQFGSGVAVSDVVDIDPGNEDTTIVADLRDARAIAANTYDCVILTQVLQFVDDIQAALRECFRILRPGGVLLVTAPNTIRVDEEAGPDGDYWRLTEASARKLFADVFRPAAFAVSTFGNVGSCSAFLHGLSVEEMSPADLDPVDPTFPLVVAVRAVKDADSVGTRAIQSRSSPGRGVILAYHRVAALTPDGHHLCTPPEVFAEQMRIVAADYRPVGLEELAHAAAAGRIPERAVAITLDDGYLDALTSAAPILAALGIPATFFVNSDRLCEEHERWWDMLERLELPAAELEAANSAMWTLDAAGRRDLVAGVLARTGIAMLPRASHRVMTADEIRRLAGVPGQTIGAHSVNHLALTTQPLETKRCEVVQDKSALEQALGKPVTLFSYPYGDVDAELVSVVRGAGFLAAVTVDAGVVTADTDLMLLPRNEVAAAWRDDFRARMEQLFGS